MSGSWSRNSHGEIIAMLEKDVVERKIRRDTMEKNCFQPGTYSLHKAYSVRASFKDIDSAYLSQGQ